MGNEGSKEAKQPKKKRRDSEESDYPRPPQAKFSSTIKQTPAASTSTGIRSASASLGRLIRPSRVLEPDTFHQQVEEELDHEIQREWRESSIVGYDGGVESARQQGKSNGKGPQGGGHDKRHRDIGPATSSEGGTPRASRSEEIELAHREGLKTEGVYFFRRYSGERREEIEHTSSASAIEEAQGPSSEESDKFRTWPRVRFKEPIRSGNQGGSRRRPTEQWRSIDTDSRVPRPSTPQAQSFDGALSSNPPPMQPRGLGDGSEVHSSHSRQRLQVPSPGRSTQTPASTSSLPHAIRSPHRRSRGGRPSLDIPYYGGHHKGPGQDLPESVRENLSRPIPIPGHVTVEEGEPEPEMPESVQRNRSAPLTIPGRVSGQEGESRLRGVLTDPDGEAETPTRRRRASEGRQRHKIEHVPVERNPFLGQTAFFVGPGAPGDQNRSFLADMAAAQLEPFQGGLLPFQGPRFRRAPDARQILQGWNERNRQTSTNPIQQPPRAQSVPPEPIQTPLNRPEPNPPPTIRPEPIRHGIGISQASETQDDGEGQSPQAGTDSSQSSETQNEGTKQPQTSSTEQPPRLYQPTETNSPQPWNGTTPSGDGTGRGRQRDAGVPEVRDFAHEPRQSPERPNSAIGHLRAGSEPEGRRESSSLAAVGHELSRTGSLRSGSDPEPAASEQQSTFPPIGHERSSTVRPRRESRSRGAPARSAPPRERSPHHAWGPRPPELQRARTMSRASESRSGEDTGEGSPRFSDHETVPSRRIGDLDPSVVLQSLYSFAERRRGRNELKRSDSEGTDKPSDRDETPRPHRSRDTSELRSLEDTGSLKRTSSLTSFGLSERKGSHSLVPAGADNEPSHEQQELPGLAQHPQTPQSTGQAHSPWNNPRRHVRSQSVYELGESRFAQSSSPAPVSSLVGMHLVRRKRDLDELEKKLNDQEAVLNQQQAEYEKKLEAAGSQCQPAESRGSQAEKFAQTALAANRKGRENPREGKKKPKGAGSPPQGRFDADAWNLGGTRASKERGGPPPYKSRESPPPYVCNPDIERSQDRQRRPTPSPPPPPPPRMRRRVSSTPKPRHSEHSESPPPVPPRNPARLEYSGPMSGDILESEEFPTLSGRVSVDEYMEPGEDHQQQGRGRSRTITAGNCGRIEQTSTDLSHDPDDEEEVTIPTIGPGAEDLDILGRRADERVRRVQAQIERRFPIGTGPAPELLQSREQWIHERGRSWALGDHQWDEEIRFEMIQGGFSGRSARIRRRNSGGEYLHPNRGSLPNYWHLLSTAPDEPGRLEHRDPPRKQPPPHPRRRSANACLPTQLDGVDELDEIVEDENESETGIEGQAASQTAELAETWRCYNWLKLQIGSRIGAATGGKPRGRSSSADDQVHPSFGLDGGKRSESRRLGNVHTSHRRSRSSGTPSSMPASAGSARQGTGSLAGSSQSMAQSSQAAQSQQNQQQVNGVGGAAHAAAGVPSGLAHAGHQSDINYLWGVVQELSEVLAQNRAQTAGIIGSVHTLRERAAREEGDEDVDGEGNANDIPEERLPDVREVNGEIRNNQAAELANLQSRLHSVQSQLSAVHTENADLSALVLDYETTLTSLMEKIRNYAYDHATAVVATHKHYAALLEKEREANLQLRLEHGQWQAGLGRAADWARKALRERAEDAAPMERKNKELRVENKALRKMVGWEVHDDDESDSDDEGLKFDVDALKKGESEIEATGGTVGAVTKGAEELSLEDAEAALEGAGTKG